MFACKPKLQKVEALALLQNSGVELDAGHEKSKVGELLDELSADYSRPPAALLNGE